MSQAMQTFGGRLRPKKKEPTNWETLVDLGNERTVIIYQRLSSHEQVKKSIYSIMAQDALKDLAIEDGYPESLIHIENRDWGISGTKGREERPGLAYLIQQVEAGLVESVYVVHMSRLHRDQTLINALSLGELFKKHGVIIITPQMRLNLRDKMHMRMYRMEIERAADELELMANRLLGARDLKARSGFYSGESLPPGYVTEEREKLPDGSLNPEYHTYKEFAPHAAVVRLIFDELATPGMTPTGVVHKLSDSGTVLAPFPPDLDTPANLKTFARSKCNPDGSWPITVYRVRNIATNPAYIGWKVWAGEVVSTDIYPPLVEEDVFWSVQKKFRNGHHRSKKTYDPLPLAGLLFCASRDIPRKMGYVNRTPDSTSYYQCRDDAMQSTCAAISSFILDGPISEAVIGQLALPEMADDVLNEMTNEYEQAKGLAASYRREKKRLDTEVENLRGNLATEVMSAKQLRWLDREIENRLVQIQELADLANQPIGAAVGRPLPGKEDIELVRDALQALRENWDKKSNALKNALLLLLLDRIVIWHDPSTVRVRLVWRFNPPRELVIHRPRKKKRHPWTEAELRMLYLHYETASHRKLVDLLPRRTWRAIARKGNQLGLLRQPMPHQQGTPYTAEDDEVIRRYYCDEIGRDEVMAMGRSTASMNKRAQRLGLKWQPRSVTWQWLPNPEEEDPS